MNTASGAAAAMTRSSTWKPSNARRPRVGLALLAHRRPHVGVHGAGTGDGLVRAGWSRRGSAPSARRRSRSASPGP